MNIREAYGPGKFGLSFELFPPKTEKGETALFAHVEKLMAFQPSYITCTYGAGGSTHEKTLDIISHVREQYGCAVASHLTCVGSTREELFEYLRETADRDIRNIVALRGDPPQGTDAFEQVEGGLRYASELVELIRSRWPEFGIAVAGYPETHREAESPQADLENLRRKVDAGGDVILTQLFYNNSDFFRFRDACTELGITVPIVPGILPVTNLAQIERITSLCGASLPVAFKEDLGRCGDDAAQQFDVGVDFARGQVQELLEQGVPGVHFYVLNKSKATGTILASLQIPTRD
ncbi:MAG TPA: methylenetetrahydrofolate reductase [NAD(P)H] [Pirellulales bacterium]|jgi:methylenetetrahydrofolate reductase (NADPH)|nr:methylenetetrahydrofolate reductase [NAD(P)H] [Pirellulales bacterium]